MNVNENININRFNTLEYNANFNIRTNQNQNTFKSLLKNIFICFIVSLFFLFSFNFFKGIIKNKKLQKNNKTKYLFHSHLHDLEYNLNLYRNLISTDLFEIDLSKIRSFIFNSNKNKVKLKFKNF